MAKYDSVSVQLQKIILSDREKHWVNPYAFKDENVLRREMNHDAANLWRPAFVRDVEKIMHVPFYNRYADKTQVFSLYRNDDITRRSEHVQIVSRIARNIGRVLGLNEDLIEAISLGHDIGHTPFGHAGEKKLSELYFKETGRYFNHNVHSVRILDKICCLNLSMQTLDGILCHNGEMELRTYIPQPYHDFKLFDKKIETCYIDNDANKAVVPATLEACVMRIADIIAYLGKDRQDAAKLNIYQEEPDYYGEVIGKTNAEIINNLTVNIIENSYGKDHIEIEQEYFDALSCAKKENYEYIYDNKTTVDMFKDTINPMIEKMFYELLEQARSKDKNSLIYRYHIEYIRQITQYSRRTFDYALTDPVELVVDFIASMTDDFFISMYSKLFGEISKIKYKDYFDE